jgi:hypothetical protein
MSARLEQVEVEPYFAGLARVRLWLNLMTLQGQQITDVKPEELQLIVGGTRLKPIPGIQFFEQRDDLLDIVIVVELHSSFSAAIEELEEPLGKFISKLNKSTTRVALVTYGEEVKKQVALGDPSRAARKWKRLVADDVPAPPGLVEALDDAIKILASSQPTRPASTRRKLIIVISDGNDQDVQAPETRDEFRKLSKAAKKADITFHTIAFSFLDNREPFLNLGELSKKSNGTFRWARNRADFANFLDALNLEIRRQMVLTYFMAPASIEGKTVKVACRSARCGEGSLESNEVRAPEASCAGQACTGAAACVDDVCLTAAMVGARGGGGAIWLALLLVAAAGGGGALVVRKMKRAAAEAEEAAAASALPSMGDALAQKGQAMPQMPQVAANLANVPYVGAHVAQNPYAQQIAAAQNNPYAQQIAAAQNNPYAQQAAAQRPAAAAPGPAKVAQVTVVNGPRQGQTLPLRHGFTVGRTPGCDLVIDDGMTSGYHAQFHLDTAGGVTIVDLGSTNGTYVNGVRSQSARLAHGMSLRIGQTDLRFLQG